MEGIHVVAYLCSLKPGGRLDQRRGGTGNEEGKDDELASGSVTCEVRSLMDVSNLQVVLKL